MSEQKLCVGIIGNVPKCLWNKRFANGWQTNREKQKWKLTNPHNDKVFMLPLDYKYCPYCGREIVIR